MMQNSGAVNPRNSDAQYGERQITHVNGMASWRNSPGLDYVLLLFLLLSYVFLLPEAPHGDGVRWAESLETHHIDVNPNYVLMQPIALALYTAWEAVGLPSNGTQFQKYCDVFVGILTLFLLNQCLRSIAVPDIFRRLCVVFAAFSYNFFYLATSDHIKLITAPFLLLTMWCLIRYFKTGRPSALAGAGLFMGLSLCTLVNAAAWFGLLVPLVFILEGPPLFHRLRATAIFGLSATVPALVIFVASYFLSSPEKSFLAWLTSYGSNVSTQEVGFGGLNILTIGRALSAIAKNFAFSGDLGPAAKALAHGGALPQTSLAVLLLNGAALLAISGVLLRILWWAISSWPRWAKDDRCLVLTMASAVFGYFVFGLVWNSSEEEFWFQITAPLVILIAMFLKNSHQGSLDRCAVVIILVLVIANTLLTFALPRHAYPYFKYVDNLSAVVGTTNLLIYDGSEPVNGLVYGARRKGSLHAVGLSSSLGTHGYDLQETLAFIAQEIQQTRAQGGKVYVCDILSPQSTSHPWTLLRERFGIQKEDVASFLKSQGTYRSIELAGQPAWMLEAAEDERKSSEE